MIGVDVDERAVETDGPFEESDEYADRAGVDGRGLASGGARQRGVA